MSAVVQTPWEGWPACPCGCGMEGLKLSTKTGHLVRLCTCTSCVHRRSQAKGKRGQAKGHRALGGIGFTPSNEESTNAYEIRVQVEHKHGYKGQTTKLYGFIATEFFRRALSQAERARRVGDGSMPAVMFDGRWLLVDCKRGKDGVA